MPAVKYLAGDAELATAVSEFYADPLGFVMFAWPWGEPGRYQNMTGPDKWQREFLEDLGAEVRKRGFDGRHAVEPILMAAGSGRGVGKAQPVDLIVDTPDGSRRWGDLTVGDRLFAHDGTTTKITSVHPQGSREVFQVKFDDRSSTVADGDHVWSVKGRQQRRKWLDFCNLTTKEIAAQVKRPSGAGRLDRQWEIPNHRAVAIDSQPTPIHPYVLGLWLGDGARNSSCITTKDAEVKGRIKDCGYEFAVSTDKRTDAVGCHLYGLQPKLRKLGILDRYSYQKRIPQSYLFNDASVRAEILRGLLDTDGEVNSHGSIIFNSTSKGLVQDVIWLARSLGGKAQMQPATKKGKYRRPDGEMQVCRDCYRATLSLPDGFRPFYVEAKQRRVKPHTQRRYRTRWIESISRVGRQECMCVTVDHPSGLYLTNDFIVTHNTKLCGWLATWILATRPHSKLTVTANTFTQLETRTWAAVREEISSSIVARWFVVTSDRIFRIGYKDSWFSTAQTCKKENSQAFAGQQSIDSTSAYICDEASTIPDQIFEVAKSGLSTGEPMMFIFGNVTETSGQLYRALFGDDRDIWNGRSIDARESAIANQEEIKRDIELYGEDSDYVRVWRRGLAPRASSMQFIDSERVRDAQSRTVEVYADEPLVAGLDVARGGKDMNVLRFRRGRDARSIPPMVIPGEQTRDTMQLAAWVVEQLGRTFNGRKIDTLFVDSGFGGPVVNRCHQLNFKNVIEVNSANTPPDPHFFNMRAYMWDRVKSWLLVGSIDSHRDGRWGSHLEVDLTGPYFHHTKEKLVIESKESMKERGLGSPHQADSLCLTFAMNIAPKKAPSATKEFRRRAMVSQWG